MMDTPWVSLGWVEEDDLELEDRGWRLVFVDWMGEEERSMVGVGVGWGAELDVGSSDMGVDSICTVFLEAGVESVVVLVFAWFSEMLLMLNE